MPTHNLTDNDIQLLMELVRLNTSFLKLSGYPGDHDNRLDHLDRLKSKLDSLDPYIAE